MEDIFENSLVVSLLFAGALYFTKFNDLSENELVRWSYVWLPMLVFGIVGMFALKNGQAAGLHDPFKTALVTAIKFTVIGMALLIIFYETVWQDL